MIKNNSMPILELQPYLNQRPFVCNENYKASEYLLHPFETTAQLLPVWNQSTLNCNEIAQIIKNPATLPPLIQQPLPFIENHVLFKQHQTTNNYSQIASMKTESLYGTTNEPIPKRRKMH